MEDEPVKQDFGAIKARADPINVLKKRKMSEKSVADRVADVEKRKAAKKAKTIDTYKSAEKFVKEHRSVSGQRRTFNRKTAEAKLENSRRAEGDAQLLFVVRLGGASALLPKARKVLHQLRLDTADTGVFVKSSATSRRQIKSVEQHLAYGMPTLKSVKELIFKHGFGQEDKLRVPLSDNAVVEKALGETGIVCLEDLVSEIHTLGPNFQKATQFLHPFDLRPSKEKAKLKQPANTPKKVHVKTQPSDRGDKINQLIQNML